MSFGLHVIKNPNGTYSFVGTVPVELGYVNKEGNPPTEKQLRTALQCGPGFAGLKTLVWKTKEEAVAEAENRGYKVANSPL